jgi:hypothetical protein
LSFVVIAGDEINGAFHADLLKLIVVTISASFDSAASATMSGCFSFSIPNNLSNCGFSVSGDPARERRLIRAVAHLRSGFTLLHSGQFERSLNRFADGAFHRVLVHRKFLAEAFRHASSETCVEYRRAVRQDVRVPSRIPPLPLVGDQFGEFVERVHRCDAAGFDRGCTIAIAMRVNVRRRRQQPIDVLNGATVLMHHESEHSELCAVHLETRS